MGHVSSIFRIYQLKNKSYKLFYLKFTAQQFAINIKTDLGRQSMTKNLIICTLDPQFYQHYHHQHKTLITWKIVTSWVTHTLLNFNSTWLVYTDSRYLSELQMFNQFKQILNHGPLSLYSDRNSRATSAQSDGQDCNLWQFNISLTSMSSFNVKVQCSNLNTLKKQIIQATSILIGHDLRYRNDN